MTGASLIRHWKYGEFCRRWVIPALSSKQEDTDTNHIVNFMKKFDPQISIGLPDEASFDTVAMKYVDWDVYAFDGQYKSKFGKVESFGRSDANVVFESHASYMNSAVPTKRKFLMAYVYVLLVAPVADASDRRDGANLLTGYPVLAFMKSKFSSPQSSTNVTGLELFFQRQVPTQAIIRESTPLPPIDEPDFPETFEHGMC